MLESNEHDDVAILEQDEPPKSGVWVETCEVLDGDLTEDEREAGRLDGETVDYEGCETEPTQ